MSLTRGLLEKFRESASRWPVGWLAVLVPLVLVAVPALGQDSSDDFPGGPIGTGRPAHVAQGTGTCPAPINVCYYDLSFGQGNPSQVSAITSAGHAPVDVVTPDAAGLADCAVLFAQNPSNGGFAGEWTANLGDIDAAVQGGMALVFHDRYVSSAAMDIPGLMGTNCVRDFADDTNIDIANGSTTVTSGLDNTSLDGGNSSSHGYCDSLPGGAVNILSRSVASESVTFRYPYGAGQVIYSTIPLDFYLGGSGSNPPRDNFVGIYAPNVVAYAGELFCAADVPTMPGGALAALLMLLLLLPMLLSRRRQRA